MLIVGLTGGIGSGKTTVANLLADKGVPVIDTDQIARELVAAGQPALSEITTQFGAEILNPDGSLNRPLLRDIVFSDPDGKKQLEAILHPRIREAVRHHLNTIDAPYAILVVPLLFESDGYDFTDHNIVVDCSEEEQITRTMLRDQTTRAQVEEIMASQWSRQQRLQSADSVLQNSTGAPSLTEQVEMLHHQLLTKAQQQGSD